MQQNCWQYIRHNVCPTYLHRKYVWRTAAAHYQLYYLKPSYNRYPVLYADCYRSELSWRTECPVRVGSHVVPHYHRFINYHAMNNVLFNSLVRCVYYGCIR